MRKTQPSETGEPADRYADRGPRTAGFGPPDPATPPRPDAGAPERRNDGPRDDGPRDDGPRDDGPRDDGPRGDGPRGDGPRGDGPRSDGPRSDGPLTAGFSPQYAGAPDRGAPDRGAPDRAPRPPRTPEHGAPSAERGASGSGLPGSGLPGSGLPGSDLSTPWDDGIGSFGTWLRRQREGREITLEEIAEESKISLVNLRAFEEDRFEVLPAPVFAKGFLRQYARYVGLDPEEVVNFYVSACRSAEGEEEPVVPLPEAQNGSSWKLGAVALLLTALFALAIWGLTRWNEQPPIAPTAAPTSRATSEPTASATASTAAEGSVATGSEPVLMAPDAEPQRTDTPSAGEAGGDSPDSGSPDAGSPDGAPANLQVTLDFSGECWVEAQVDGERLVAENKIQGESLLFEAAESLEITVGNFDAVRVEVNGLPFDFDQVPGTKVRTQRIDLETVTRLAAPQEEEPGT